VKLHLRDFDEDGLCGNFALLGVEDVCGLATNEEYPGSRDPFVIPGFFSPLWSISYKLSGVQ
jgi:hypothetical protein